MGLNKQRSSLVSALALGVVAGMRSQMPLAILSWKFRGMAEDGKNEVLSALVRKAWFAPALTTLAVGELIGDKLPMTPSRLDTGPLLGRLLFGGLAGGAAANQSGQRSGVGALAGASGALMGSLVGYYARRTIVKASGIPDPVVAIAEDALALGVGTWAVREIPERLT